jgi:hypothetical protein
MNTIGVRRTWAFVICAFMIAMLATVVVTAQNKSSNPIPPLSEDTAINPHDFNNSFYQANGIVSKLIIERRNGTDLLSVFSPSSNPTHSGVRVLATLPGYGPKGEMMYWFPLGELNYNGFTEDKNGVIARENAVASPIYFFPMKVDNANNVFSYNNVRQAALFTPATTYYDDSPGYSTGLRLIVKVDYTAAAHHPKFAGMMKYLMQKNGEAVDGMPIIKTIDDLEMLKAEELVSFETKALWDDSTLNGAFAIAPVIFDPTGGAIARDAFLLMPTHDGQPMPSELIFATQFGCLQKTGTWCKE